MRAPSRRSPRSAPGSRTETVVVVAHGGVVRSVLADVLGLPDERIFRLAVEPASLTTVEWLGDEPVVTARQPAGIADSTTRSQVSRRANGR